ncbi:diguanylate cyclase (GGDEF)-like protein/PAS domain S-box-containing protein [Paucibacter oligotrophus]|uniref:Diguanylate cyclase (GGDEF)-like protein/PAS domain S-box-containing protein n=1 Tax=Roseateles oligotrophus TaxID=1769250 RepID=A0A840LHG5_9BURK|nr:diguanylate cyclase [Roseateles oligotrophus]MBB4845459.1 diguanylate cyclase (GGDEF)-like protein/PAS domain S-box-containing protein [Roseateles oligotrophus]
MTERLPLLQRVVRSFETLKFQVGLAGLLLLLIGMSASVLVLIHKAQSATLSERQHAEVSEAVRTASLLAHRMVQHQRALTALAKDVQPATLHPEELSKFLQTHLRLQTNFSSFFMVDTGGNLLGTVDKTGFRRPEVNVQDRDYFTKALRLGQPQVSAPLISRVSKEPVVILAQPLMEQGRVWAVMGAVLRLQSQNLLEGVAESVGGEDGVLVVVSDAKGLILAHPDSKLVGSSIRLEPRLRNGFEAWQQAGQPLEPAGLHLRDAKELLGAAGVPAQDWMVWRARETRAVLAPLAAAQHQAVIWTLSIAAVLATVLTALIWWLLQPLSQLRQRASHLFDGAIDVNQDWPHSRGEVAQLQQVLQRVARERANFEASNAFILGRLQSVMEAAPIGIAFSRRRRFELVSVAFCKLFGHTAEQLLGQPTRLIYAFEGDFDALSPQVREAFEAGRHYQGDWQMLRADGSTFWGRLSGQPVDPQDHDAGAIWTVSDISEEVSSRLALEWSAKHDNLTGLANRREFMQRLETVYAMRSRAKPAALIAFDLDRFKEINDSQGHAAGDAMLKAVADVAAAAIRAGDLLARLGGDEFAVLLERCHGDGAERVAHDLLQAIQTLSMEWQGQRLSVGASVGVAALSEDMGSAADWLMRADLASYAAKRAGRGTVRNSQTPAEHGRESSEKHQ